MHSVAQVLFEAGFVVGANLEIPSERSVARMAGVLVSWIPRSPPNQSRWR